MWQRSHITIEKIRRVEKSSKEVRMSRTVLFGLCFSLFFAFVFSPGLLGYTEQGTMAGESALILDLRRAVQDSTDDAQQAINGGSVFASIGYMELMNNWFCKRWGGGVRFPNITIPQGSQIHSAYISVVSYSTCWLRTYDSVACESVDSASSFSTAQGSYNISNRWSNRTNAVLLWNEDMRNSSIYPDSTPDLKDLLGEVIDRPNWKPGNSVVFIFKNIRDLTDSAMFEFRTWEDAGWEESLFISYTPPSDVHDEDSLMRESAWSLLDQNYPNPFNLNTNIYYCIPSQGEVKLTIYDLLGRRVRTLLDGYQSDGCRSLNWDGRDEQGNTVASGIYFYRLDSEAVTQTKKMLLLK
jgi:hypothetical protein